MTTLTPQEAEQIADTLTCEGWKAECLFRPRLRAYVVACSHPPELVGRYYVTDAAAARKLLRRVSSPPPVRMGIDYSWKPMPPSGDTREHMRAFAREVLGEHQPPSDLAFASVDFDLRDQCADGDHQWRTGSGARGRITYCSICFARR